MADGKHVSRARTRGSVSVVLSLLRLYETHIYGRVPANAPKIRWEVAETDPHARDGAALLKKVIGHVGSKPDGPQIRVSVYTPAQATKKVPIILLLNFGAGRRRRRRAAGAGGRGNAATASRRTPRRSSRADGAMRPSATTTSSPIAPTRGRKG